MFELYKAV